MNRLSLVMIPEVEDFLVEADLDLGRPGVRSTHAPCSEYSPGTPSGTCETDGHYLCIECKHLNPECEYVERNTPLGPPVYLINRATLVTAVVAAWVLSKPNAQPDKPSVGIWDAVVEVFEMGAFPAWKDADLIHILEDGSCKEEDDLLFELEHYQSDLSYSTAQARARGLNLSEEQLEEWGIWLRCSNAVSTAVARVEAEIAKDKADAQAIRQQRQAQLVQMVGRLIRSNI